MSHATKIMTDRRATSGHSDTPCQLMSSANEVNTYLWDAFRAFYVVIFLKCHDVFICLTIIDPNFAHFR